MKIVVLGSGSKGNSTFIDFGTKKILIDVGFSYKQIKERLELIKVDPKEIDAVFITHDHSDHTYGLKVFLKKVKPYLYITKEVEQYILEEQYEQSVYLTDEMFLDDIFIKVIPTSHDALTANGYLFEHNGESVVYITDTGYLNHRNFVYLKDKNYYIFESNHDIEMLMNGKYPYHLKQRILGDKGHLSNKDCAYYLTEFTSEKTKNVILAHLSEENNCPEKAIEAYNNAYRKCGKAAPRLLVAKQKERTEVIELWLKLYVWGKSKKNSIVMR